MGENAEGRLGLAALLVLVAAAAPLAAACMYRVAAAPPAGGGVDWPRLAARAWSYFAPGVGVDEKTGISKASNYWPRITDWDLGNYVVATVDARELGLISDEGPWGFRHRIEKVLSFLESRPLRRDGLPYSWYESSTGRPWSESPANFWDTGMLLLALDYLRRHAPEYSDRILSIVSRARYEKILVGNPRGPYGYLCSWGFKKFGLGDYDPDRIMADMISCRSCAELYGLRVPDGLIGEPIALSALILGPGGGREKLMSLFTRVMEARYNRTGLLSAWSEGNTGLESPSYVYEYVALGGRTWLVASPGRGEVSLAPIAYVKIAAAMHAVAPSWYTRLLLSELVQRTATQHGFYEGVAEDGRLAKALIDKTNAMIVMSARYALRKRGAAG